MLLTELAKKIEGADIATSGENLFVHEMPSEVKSGVLMLEPLRGFEKDHELPGYRKGRFGVVVRAPDYQTGYPICLAVEKALTLVEADCGAFFVKYCRSVHDPVRFPVSGADLIEFSLHFDACWVVVDGETLPV